MKRVAHGEPNPKALPASFRQGFFMTYCVYIMQSETSGRYYCGQSTNLDQRLRQHNDPTYRLTKTTKRFPGPWNLVWTYRCADASEATLLERRIKKRGIARYLMDQGSAESRQRRD